MTNGTYIFLNVLSVKITQLKSLGNRGPDFIIEKFAFWEITHCAVGIGFFLLGQTNTDLFE